MNTIELATKTSMPPERMTTPYRGILSQSAQTTDLDTCSLINLIVTQYHIKAKQDIVLIYDLAQKVFAKHNEIHSELGKLVETLFLFFDDLLFHLKKEEQILFPNIIELTEKKLHEGFFTYSTFGIIKEYVAVMKAEHREVVDQLQLLRQLTRDYALPDDACSTYGLLYAKMKEFEYDMVQHIQLENNFLFPRAVEMEHN